MKIYGQTKGNIRKVRGDTWEKIGYEGCRMLRDGHVAILD